MQEKRVYSDGKYAHGVFISDCKMKICSLSSTAHISPYHLNLEFPLMLTKTFPLSIFAHIFYKRDQPHLQGFESISNTMIRSKTKSLFWGNGKTHVMVMQKKDKSNSPFRNFIKSCFTLIWNTNLAPRASKKALDVLGTNKRRSFWINRFNWITCLFSF